MMKLLKHVDDVTEAACLVPEKHQRREVVWVTAVNARPCLR